MTQAHKHTVWSEPTVLPDGHRLFYAIHGKTSNGRPLIAICDDSGNYPEQTDDGILWLDFDNDLMVGGEVPTIPVLTPDSEVRQIPTDTATIMVLSNRFEWNINVLGTRFRAFKI